MVRLAQGDLAGARGVLEEIPPDVEPTAVVANLGHLLGPVLGAGRRPAAAAAPAGPPRRSTTTGGRGGSRWRPPTRSGATRAGRAPTPTRPPPRRGADQGDADNAQLYVLLGTALAYPAERTTRCAKESSRSRYCRSPRTPTGRLYPAPARADLHPGRRAGQGAGPARAAPRAAVLLSACCTPPPPRGSSWSSALSGSPTRRRSARAGAGYTPLIGILGDRQFRHPALP